MEIHGVYRIKNIINNKSYIGQSYGNGGIYNRWEEHKRGLRRGSHSNKKLQNAWNKYGEENFEFSILIIMNGDDRLGIDEQECIFIAFFDSIKHGYNNREGGQNGGILPAQRELARVNALRQFSTQEGRDKASKAQLRRFQEQGVSEETRARQSKSQSGRKHTEETKKKISDAAKTSQRVRFDTHGVSEETRRKISEAGKGKKRGPYANKGKKNGPSNMTVEGRARLVESAKKRTYSEETRKRMSDAQKRRHLKIELATDGDIS